MLPLFFAQLLAWASGRGRQGFREQSQGLPAVAKAEAVLAAYSVGLHDRFFDPVRATAGWVHTDMRADLKITDLGHFHLMG